MKDKVRKTLVLVIMAVLGAALAGAAVYFYSRTVVAWWLPLLAGALFGVLAACVLRGFRALVAESIGGIGAWLAVFVFGLCAGAALLLWGNRTFADPASEHQELVTIQSKHIEEHRTRRYSRGRYIGSGSKYNTYHLVLRFDDGSTKELSVPRSEYNRVRTGSRRTYTLARGAFGFPVIL